MFQGTVLYYFGDMKIKKDIIFANNELRELRKGRVDRQVCNSVTGHITGQVQTSGEAHTMLSSG